MLEKTIMLNNVESVKKFSNIAASKNYNIYLESGKYVVNAKSIMGIFSLDLTKPIKMKADCELVAELSKQIEPFVLKNDK